VDYVVLLRFGRRQSPGGPRFPSLWSLWIGGRSASDADGQAHCVLPAEVRQKPKPNSAG
jgi:hypothetical protein